MTTDCRDLALEHTAPPCSRMVSIQLVDLAYAVMPTRGAMLHVLKNITFSVDQHEFVCILGPSGCGKTTLLNLIAGFVSPSSGTIHLSSAESHQSHPEPAMVFQEDTTFGWMTVEDNLLSSATLSRPLESAKAAVAGMLALLKLARFRKYYPRELSGGMRKRLEFGRAWLSASDALLLDEPLAQLDAITRSQMHTEISRLRTREPRTLLMVTHDIEEALLLADRVLVLSQRPSSILTSQSVSYPQPRSSEIRFSPEFQRQRHSLEILLRGHDIDAKP